mmetsp:Transcript_65047/g.155336  ORF Transcript_65047/g.155336 Transcript_65047/m.155336 type:complete len:82 (+) Transcript_65047:190-435(+)
MAVRHKCYRKKSQPLSLAAFVGPGGASTSLETLGSLRNHLHTWAEHQAYRVVDDVASAMYCPKADDVNPPRLSCIWLRECA